MFRLLFDQPEIAVVECDGSEELPMLPEEERHVVSAVPKRRREFSSGRGCARRALAQLGIPDGSFAIDRREDRTPIWPDGFIGSISHTAGHCAAVVSRNDSVLGIGIDAEDGSPLKPEIAARICRPGELARLASLGTHDPLRWAKLVFSAKESFYKAHFPKMQTGLGFQDAELEIDPQESSFLIRLTNDDKPGFGDQRETRGRFHFGDLHVFSAVWFSRQGG